MLATVLSSCTHPQHPMSCMCVCARAPQRPLSRGCRRTRSKICRIYGISGVVNPVGRRPTPPGITCIGGCLKCLSASQSTRAVSPYVPFPRLIPESTSRPFREAQKVTHDQVGSSQPAMLSPMYQSYPAQPILYQSSSAPPQVRLPLRAFASVPCAICKSVSCLGDRFLLILCSLSTPACCAHGA